ncbi:MAG TPA: hypothetical protein VL738_01675 [Dactylosporangium sp.]|nr:hypothetical protein [Dactylosporangium sp.]
MNENRTEYIARAAETLRQDLRIDEQPFREAVADLLDDMVAEMRHEGVATRDDRNGLFSNLTGLQMSSWEDALNVATAYLGEAS